MGVIDVAALLGEITSEAPCGEDLEYDPDFVEMEQLAQGTPERQYGDTIIPAEPPDWRGVGQKALRLLTRTRDLRVAVYLTRALLPTEGFTGFAAGLTLVCGFLERFWLSVYPQLDPDDDNDPLLRINTVVALCDPETTLRSLREMPLVNSRLLGKFSLRDVQIASGALTLGTAEEQASAPTQAKIDGAFQDAALEELQITVQTLTEAIDQAERIEAVLTEQVGVTQAPDMSALANLLKEMRQVITEQLQRRGVSLTSGAVAEATSEEPSTGSVAGGGVRAVAGEISSRDDALRMLDKIAEYFERYEPSSPVPLLLKRAKRLVAKDFMAILNDLAPGGTEQASLIFGVHGEETTNSE